MPLNDPFAGSAVGIGPITDHEAITPSDSANCNYVSREIYVGVGGDVALVTYPGDVAVTYKNAASGSTIVGRFKRVNNTNTTATNLVNRW